MQKQHMSVDDKYRLVCFLKFEDDRLPEVYIIPATAWQKPNAILVDRKYDKPGQKSKPEWGISYTIKNKKLIENIKQKTFWLSIFIGGATMPFKIVRNDITRVKADVIVNTANPNPICVSGTDLAIYEAAGKEKLLAERANIGKIARGDIAVTGAYNLKAKYIIHTVGPVWTDGLHHEFEILKHFMESLLC